MAVMFRGLMSGLNFDDMKAKSGQASHVAKRLIYSFCIGIQEMGLLCSFECFNLVFGQNVGVCPHRALQNVLSDEPQSGSG
jgi:hypothetical protein